MRVSRLIAILLFCVTSFLFVYRLDYSSLQSFDEAWYAVIAREVTQHSNILELHYNGIRFTDHPPLQFWIMSLSQKVFSSLFSEEFATRFPSAVMGIATVLLVYKMGLHLSKKWWIGLVASLFLLTSLWFMLRARSGNLDVPLVFLMTITMYFGQRMHSYLQEKKQFMALQQLLPLTIAFGLTLITKTVVGVTLIPAILVVMWPLLMQIKNPKFVKSFVLSAVVLAVIVFPWYIYNAALDSHFLYHHFFEIGLRGVAESSTQETAFWQNTLYLRSGIGVWYWPAVAGLLLSTVAVCVVKEYRQKLLPLFIWFLVPALLLFFNAKTQVWHLLPLYPPLFLLSSFTFIEMISWVAQRLRVSKKARLFLQLSFTLCVVLLATNQVRQSFSLVVPPHAGKQPEAVLGTVARDIPGELYLLTGEGPSASFYAQRKVTPIGIRPNAYQEMVDIMKSDPTALFMVLDEHMKQFVVDGVAFEVVHSTPLLSLVRGKS